MRDWKGGISYNSSILSFLSIKFHQQTTDQDYNQNCARQCQRTDTNTTPDIRAAESTIFKRLQLRLRLRPENSTPTPTPTPLRLQSNKRFSILKRTILCSHFLDFPFDCIQTGGTVIQHPFALTADAAGRGHH